MNLQALVFLAAGTLDPAVTPPSRGGKFPTFLFSDMFLILMAGVALGVGIAIWIKIAKRPKSPSINGRVREKIIEKDGEEVLKVKKRHRRRRRDHRGRNPSLAETGGLPPSRPEGAAPRGL